MQGEAATPTDDACGGSALEGAVRRRIWTAAGVLVTGLAAAAFAHVLVDPLSASIAAWSQQQVLPVAKFVTRFGEGYESLVPAGCLVLACSVWLWLKPAAGPAETLRRLACMGWFVVLSIGGTGLVAALIKNMIGRARPFAAPAGDTAAFAPFAFTYRFAAFPSGHATTAGATAMTIALLFPRLTLPAFALFAVVASSRVLVGAHYPSDVAAGFALGVAGTLVVAALFARRGRVFRRLGGCWHRIPLRTPRAGA